MKKPIIIIAIIFGAIILIFAVLLIMLKSGFRLPEPRIFADLSEFNCIKEYVTEELADDETLVEGLIIKERFCVKIDFEGKDFYVYAYVFEDEADSDEYMKRARAREDIFKSRRTINKGNRALYIIGHPNSLRFNKLLDENFTDKLNIYDRPTADSVPSGVNENP